MLFCVQVDLAMAPPEGPKSSPFSPKQVERDRSHARRDKSPRRRRRRRSDSRSEETESKALRKRSPSRRRRRKQSPAAEGAAQTVDKRPRAQDDAHRKTEEQPGDDQDDERPPCEFCGKPLTQHASGRKQHQWTNVYMVHRAPTLRRNDAAS